MNLNWGEKEVYVEATDDHRVKIVIGSADSRVVLSFNVTGARELANTILEVAADAQRGRKRFT
jgi:hypothetical protein